MNQGAEEMQVKPAATYRWLHGTNVVLLVGLWAFAIFMYPRLPDEIPAHIGTSGVTRWAERNSGFWFLLPILGSFEAAFMYLLSRLADSGASGINVPHRKRLLALPRDAQDYAIEPVRGFMYAMATWLLLLMGMLQAEMYLAAVTGAANRGFLPVVIAFSFLPLLGVRWLSRAIGSRLDERETGFAE